MSESEIKKEKEVLPHLKNKGDVKNLNGDFDFPGAVAWAKDLPVASKSEATK